MDTKFVELAEKVLEALIDTVDFEETENPVFTMSQIILCLTTYPMTFVPPEDRQKFAEIFLEEARERMAGYDKYLRTELKEGS